MCGIVGTVEPESPRRQKLIAEMSQAILHRGPDDSGTFGDADAAIAMRRLSIIDVTGGVQPVFGEGGDVACVFNGEIYNFRELRERLEAKGHRFASDSDSECIPHLYEEYGVEFARHLRGMFAIAVWDRARKRLVLVRDRLGKKPLFYRVDDSGLAFASEIRALLVDERTVRTIDEVALSHYLTYQYVPAPWTIYTSVRKLPPGHVAVFEDRRLHVRPYWRLHYVPPGTATVATEESLAEELREQLLEAVRVRLVSERPLGAFLSGGLDSSAIVAAMSRVSGTTVKTFSIGFEEESHNELPFARQVAQLYGTEHHEQIVRPDALHVLPRIAAMFGEPYADSSAIPSYYLAEMTRQHVVVALNGDGGDEALGGYTRYRAFLDSERPGWSRGVAAPARLASRGLAPLAKRSRQAARARRIASLMGESSPARRYGRFMSYFDEESKYRVMTPDLRRRVESQDSYELLQRLWDEHRGTDVVNRVLAMDTHSYLPGDLLPKVDITTMSVSLEARSPLLDHTFMEWAASLPGTYKVRNGDTKYLFKRALEPWLPTDLIHRRKQGFGVPLDNWLRGPLRSMVGDLLPNGHGVRNGWFDLEEVKALVEQHMAGVDHSPRLYALLMLELWLTEVHAQPATVPA